MRLAPTTLCRSRLDGALDLLVACRVVILAIGFADCPTQVVTGLARCEDKLGRSRVEELLKEAGLDERDASDLLVRVDQMRLKKPEPEDNRTART